MELSKATHVHLWPILFAEAKRTGLMKKSTRPMLVRCEDGGVEVIDCRTGELVTDDGFFTASSEEELRVKLEGIIALESKPKRARKYA